MIPMNTTTIQVLRVPKSPTRDPEDPKPPAEVVESGVRAHISLTRGRQPSASGTQEVVEWRMSCDVADVQMNDTVRDELTGETYQVLWARHRIGLGLSHTQVGLKQVEGVVSDPRLSL